MQSLIDLQRMVRKYAEFTNGEDYHLDIRVSYSIYKDIFYANVAIERELLEGGKGKDLDEAFRNCYDNCRKEIKNDEDYIRYEKKEYQDDEDWGRCEEEKLWGKR